MRYAMPRKMMAAMKYLFMGMIIQAVESLVKIEEQKNCTSSVPKKGVF
jgi:hypothetical protein